MERHRRKTVAAAVCFPASVALLAALWWCAPFPRAELETLPSGTVLCDREGTPLRVGLGPDDIDCRPAYRPKRSDWIVQALVAAEDRRFFSHYGVDPAAVLRAAWLDVTRLRTVSGASTLSMQVVRLLHPRPRTLVSKLIEAFRALQLERIASKDDILSQYLHRAPFGSNLVGIDAASRRYFGKAPDDLSLAEAALLAGLPQSPARLRPDRHPERARARQGYVLERMAACGFITDVQLHTARAQPLVLRPAPRPFRAPHFCDLAEIRLAGRSGGAVRTTLDPLLQQWAEETLRRAAEAPGGTAIPGGAMVILEVRTGAVRAMVGGLDFFNANAGQVNCAIAPRAAGSTLKPFAYALAYDRGLATPGTMLADVPRAFGAYRPDNFDRQYRGLIRAREALVLSLNLPALELVERIGLPVYYQTLRRLGLETLNRSAQHYGLGLVLGNADVRLLDLVNAYATFARGGEWRPVRVFEDEPWRPGRRMFSEEACWLIAEALGGEERAWESTGHAADVRLPPMAWKTGTSAGFRDAWTVAFNSEYVIGVWVGHPDGSTDGQRTGGTAAAPLAWAIARHLYLAGEGPWFTKPAGLVRREVCAVSGSPPGPHCRARVEDWQMIGVSSWRACTVHRQPPNADGHAPESWPPEVARFLARREAMLTTAQHASRALQITSPAEGGTYRILDGLTARRQSLPLRAASADTDATLHWFANMRYLGAARSDEVLFWPLAQGRYDLVCCDVQGRSDRVTITVE